MAPGVFARRKAAPHNPIAVGDGRVLPVVRHHCRHIYFDPNSQTLVGIQFLATRLAKSTVVSGNIEAVGKHLTVKKQSSGTLTLFWELHDSK